MKSAAKTDPDSSPWEDPREDIQIGVLMANGRLAPRHFTSLEEAAAWAQPGEEVVQYNTICECDR